MQLKTKKKIAKEIILLFSSGVIALIIFLMVYPYNWYCNSRSEIVQEQITSKTKQFENLDNNLDENLKQSLRDFVATANSGRYSTEDEVFAKFPEFEGYDRQILRDFVATSNSGKYSTEDEVFAKFPEFKIPSAQIKEIFKLKSEKEMWESKAWNISEHLDFSFSALLIVLIFLYPIRFLYWLIVWSFKTLMQKDDYI